MTTPLPASWAYPATCLSCSLIPVSPSMTTRITSLFSIDVKALKIEYFSIFS